MKKKKSPHRTWVKCSLLKLEIRLYIKVVLWHPENGQFKINCHCWSTRLPAPLFPFTLTREIPFKALIAICSKRHFNSFLLNKRWPQYSPLAEDIVLPPAYLWFWAPCEKEKTERERERKERRDIWEVGGRSDNCLLGLQNPERPGGKQNGSPSGLQSDDLEPNNKLINRTTASKTLWGDLASSEDFSRAQTPPGCPRGGWSRLLGCDPGARMLQKVVGCG